jgi:hypothetical protein
MSCRRPSLTPGPVSDQEMESEPVARRRSPSGREAGDGVVGADDDLVRRRRSAVHPPTVIVLLAE